MSGSLSNEPAVAEALVGLGGNLGHARETIGKAIEIFCDGAEVCLLARSSDYRTPPWGDANQPPFVNAAIAVETEVSAHVLLERALSTERRLGRDRLTQRRWGPRVIDIDILAYGDLVIENPELTLPHPRLLERAFVLIPLAEIRPDWIIHGIRVGDAALAADATGIERLNASEISAS
jgi:2-amino-4-hydroxy-6-hydroxymethyldihydropteridine diphosphokinase